MAGLIRNSLEGLGTKFISQSRPNRLRKVGDRIEVEWLQGTEDALCRDVYDTVVMAVGRSPSTSCLDLHHANIEVDVNSRKVVTNSNDLTTADYVFAIGDVALSRPELTPPAIRAGQLLARRLFGDSTKKMDYDSIATTVFTPTEYGWYG